MIRIENLSVSYKETLALKDISLALHGPTITGIIGPNGAGKSTLLKKYVGNYPTRRSGPFSMTKVKKSLHRVAYVEQKSISTTISHQGQGMCLTGTLSIYPALPHFKGQPLEKSGGCT